MVVTVLATALISPLKEYASPLANMQIREIVHGKAHCHNCDNVLCRAQERNASTVKQRCIDIASRARRCSASSWRRNKCKSRLSPAEQVGETSCSMPVAASQNCASGANSCGSVVL